MTKPALIIDHARNFIKTTCGRYLVQQLASMPPHLRKPLQKTYRRELIRYYMGI